VLADALNCKGIGKCAWFGLGAIVHNDGHYRLPL
jgi:hypothetical protein